MRVRVHRPSLLSSLELRYAHEFENDTTVCELDEKSSFETACHPIVDDDVREEMLMVESVMVFTRLGEATISRAMITRTRDDLK